MGMNKCRMWIFWCPVIYYSSEMFRGYFKLKVQRVSTLLFFHQAFLLANFIAPFQTRLLICPIPATAKTAGLGPPKSDISNGTHVHEPYLYHQRHQQRPLIFGMTSGGHDMGFVATLGSAWVSFWLFFFTRAANKDRWKERFWLPSIFVTGGFRS